MTIKKRLFHSNIRMVCVTLGSLAIAMNLGMMMMRISLNADQDTVQRFRDYQNAELRITVPLMILVLFIIIISIFNNFLTYRLTRRIVKPLEPLSEGVRQIRDNNFAYRIDYDGEDEFRPVCDAFNEMAAKLEESTAIREKDESSRRELIAGISHDLRTPLTSIKGYIEGIETGVASTPEMQKKYFSIIKSKAADMEHIIEQLFLFSKLDLDEFPVSLRRTDITLAVSDIIEDSLSEYASRGLTIKLAEMPKSIYVNSDALMLRNVIINILENSVKYKTKEQGQMEINATLINHSILLRFTDNGPGVHADMLPKLFDVFYRSDPSRSKLGSGLGLAISVKIIKRMGGSIYAELPAAAGGDGGGLSIVIKLPVLENGD